MRHISSLLRYELRTLFLTPSTYIAAVLFLLLMGFMYLFILETYSSAPQEGLPSTELFRIFWLPVLIVVPLLTMKSLAEERRQGTLENLLATPIGCYPVVMCKFISAYIFYLFIWALALGFPLIASYMLQTHAVDSRLLDLPSLVGGYSFIALSGLLYIALGIFASSLTRSQLIAGMITFSMLFLFLIGGRLLLDLPLIDYSWLEWVKSPLNYFQTFEQLDDFSRGIIDTRSIFYYVTSAFLLLGITSLSVEAKT